MSHLAPTDIDFGGRDPLAGDVWVAANRLGFWDGSGWADTWRKAIKFPCGGGFDGCEELCRQVHRDTGTACIPFFVSKFVVARGNEAKARPPRRSRRPASGG